MKTIVTVCVLMSLCCLASCSKYKRACHKILDPRMDHYAVSIAIECEGNIEAAKALFAKIPNTVCGSKEAQKALVEMRNKHVDKSILIDTFCPIVIGSIAKIGYGWMENKISCRKKITEPMIVDKARHWLCSLTSAQFEELEKTFK